MAAPIQTNSATAQFRQQLDADWNYWVSQYPEFATQLGRTEFDARWTDYTDSAIDARASYLRSSLTYLAAIARNSLDAADQVSYDLYRELLESAVEGLDLQYDALPIRSVVPTHLLMPVNQLGGIHQDVPRIIAIMRHDTVKDYETIIARLEAVPPLVDQTIALMERGLAAGITQPRTVMRSVPEQVQGQIAGDPDASPLLDAFDSFPSSISTADRDRLTARARAAYSKHVAPAFTRLKDFLDTTYLPTCREAIAITAIPKGDALYRYNVASHTTTALTPKEIHQIGLDEVKCIRAEMDKVIASSGFKGTFADFTRFLRTDPRFYFTSADSLVTAYRDIAKRADPELARLFGTLPRLTYGFREIPEAIAPAQTTAYYEPGSPRRRPRRQHVREHLQARLPPEVGDGSADAARGGPGPSSPDRARAGARRDRSIEFFRENSAKPNRTSPSKSIATSRGRDSARLALRRPRVPRRHSRRRGSAARVA